MIAPLETNLKFLNQTENPIQPNISTGSSEFQADVTPTAVQPTSQAVPQANPSPGAESLSSNPSLGPTLTPTGSGTLYDSNTPSVGSGLLSPVAQGAQAGQKSISDLALQFSTGAGQPRSFASAGQGGASGTDTLLAAIAPGAGVAEKGAGRALVGAQYSGPAGLDPNAVSRLSSAFGSLGSQAETLRTGTGIEAALTGGVPGLTPGQARFEAQKVNFDPGYQAEARTNAQNIAGLNQALEQEGAKATGFAGERAAQEKSIADQSRGFLGTQQTDISNQLQQDMAREEALQQAKQDQFNKIQETGAIADLPGEFQAGFTTPGGGQSADAKTAWDQINASHPELAQYAPLERIITRTGSQNYGIKDSVTGKVTPLWKAFHGKEGNKIKQALMARQAEYEAQFGTAAGVQKQKPGAKPSSPDSFAAGSSSHPLRPASSKRPPYMGAKLTEQAPFRDVSGGLYGGDPADFGNDFYEPQDIRSFVHFKPAAGLSVGNLATDGQIETFNNISDLLGQANQLSRDGSPFQAASIAAETDRYLAEEEKALAERGSKLNAQEKDWRSRVRAARKAFNKAKDAEAWGLVARIGADTLTFGAYEGLRTTPAVQIESQTGGLLSGGGIGSGRGATPIGARNTAAAGR